MDEEEADCHRYAKGEKYIAMCVNLLTNLSDLCAIVERRKIGGAVLLDFQKKKMNILPAIYLCFRNYWVKHTDR